MLAGRQGQAHRPHRGPAQRWRICDPGVFHCLSAALLERRQLHFTYTARYNQQTSDRTVSPQRLMHDGDNWYLDAWDPDRTDLRRFSVDLVRGAELQRDPCLDLSQEEVSARMDGGFGAFGGQVLAIATLRFTAHAATWVKDERWHPDQKIRPVPGGGIELDVPYAHPRQLLMAILGFAVDVEVIGPASLRRAVREAHRAGAAVYGGEED